MFRKVIGIIAAIGVCGIAACSVEPTFDYDTASPEAREIWLSERAQSMSKGFENGINANGITRFNVSEPKIDSGKRVITLTASMTMPNARMTGSKDKLRNEILAKMCPRYVRSQFYRQNIKIVQRTLHHDGSTAFVTKQTPSSCDRINERMNKKNAGA